MAQQPHLVQVSVVTISSNQIITLDLPDPRQMYHQVFPTVGKQERGKPIAWSYLYKSFPKFFETKTEPVVDKRGCRQNSSIHYWGYKQHRP